MSTSLEGAGARHEGLGGAAFLGRTAVVAHAARDAALGQVVLDRGRREQRAEPSRLWPQPWPLPPWTTRSRLGDPGDLAQPRQRIIFAENRDHRPTFAGLADHGGRDTGHILAYPKPLPLEHGGVLGDRAVFGVRDLRNLPDPVGQQFEVVPLGVDQVPNPVRIAHDASLPLMRGDVPLEIPGQRRKDLKPVVLPAEPGWRALGPALLQRRSIDGVTMAAMEVASRRVARQARRLGAFDAPGEHG